MIVYDVGAGDGRLMLLFASLTGGGGTVTAFERITEKYLSLLMTAASDRIVPITVNLATLGAVYAQEESRSKDGRVPVPAMRLDYYAGQGNGLPNLIRINVGGKAGAVLAGASWTITRFRPVIYVDIHSEEEAEGVADFLRPLGYGIENQPLALIARP